MALQRLSTHEFNEINHLIDAGLSDKEIAFCYNVSERTIYAIRRNRYNINHWSEDEETRDTD